MRIALALLIALAGCASNLQNNSCNPACSTGFHCDNGSCVFDGIPPDGGGDGGPATCNPACSGATSHCNSSHHCVACLVDDDCPRGQICKILGDTVASCVAGCADDTRCQAGGGAPSNKCCNKQCVDTSQDASNCGACGMSCVAPHSSATCTASACGAGKCENGWGDCDGNPKNGCEANLHLDTGNCTMCGMGCMLAHAIAACSDGCYISACDFGFDDCNQDQMDGCETSVLSDTNNCGGCGVPCNALPNAMANCTAGNCVLGTCNDGFYDCDNNPMTGCEANIASDPNNCGACGNKCGNGLVCKNGGCTCAMCNFPNAVSSCVNNMCIMGACNANFADCNKNPNDGCEVDLRFNNNNCGSCGTVCQNGLFCISSQCVVTMCGDKKLEGNEEYDPPPGPFMSVMVDQGTCRWHFENVPQLYCNGACSWTGGNDCQQADADLFCKLRTGNPNSKAMSFTKTTALAMPGFPCPLGGNYGVNLGPLPTRGVNQNVYYQDSSILANHGAGNVITNPVCN
jgi:hypothetical protein